MDKIQILQGIKSLAEQELNKKVFVPGVSPVPVSGAVLFPEDIEELADTVLQFWYTDWKKCAAFKRELCKVTGKKHCVLVNSGSSASLIALTALINQSKGKHVITTAIGFPSTIYPIYQNNKVPIFIDVDPKTLSPDWKQFIHFVDDKDVNGYVFAHTLGFPFDETWAVDRRWFIADCCDALGAKIDDNPVGYHADAMTLSFFPAHQITSAEGGAILTDNDELAKYMEKLVNWGRDCDCLPGQSNTCGKRFNQNFPHLPKGWDHKYTFTELGYNLKMTEFQAALGYSQLKHLDYFVAVRDINYNYLQMGLDQYDGFFNFVEVPSWSQPSYFGFPIMVDEDAPFTAQDLIDYLEMHKIATRRVFGGNLTRQPFMQDRPYLAMDLSGSNYIMENCLWIGCHPQLTKAHLDYVLDVFADFFKEKGLK